MKNVVGASCQRLLTTVDTVSDGCHHNRTPHTCEGSTTYLMFLVVEDLLHSGSRSKVRNRELHRKDSVTFIFCAQIARCVFARAVASARGTAFLLCNALLLSPLVTFWSSGEVEHVLFRLDGRSCAVMHGSWRAQVALEIVCPFRF